MHSIDSTSKLVYACVGKKWRVIAHRTFKNDVRSPEGRDLGL